MMAQELELKEKELAGWRERVEGEAYGEDQTPSVKLGDFQSKSRNVREGLLKGSEQNIYLSGPWHGVVSSFDPPRNYTNLHTNANTPGLTSVPTRKVTATNTSRAYSR